MNQHLLYGELIGVPVRMNIFVMSIVRIIFPLVLFFIESIDWLLNVQIGSPPSPPRTLKQPKKKIEEKQNELWNSSCLTGDEILGALN